MVFDLKVKQLECATLEYSLVEIHSSMMLLTCTRLHHRSANHHPSANEAIAIRYNVIHCLPTHPTYRTIKT